MTKILATTMRPGVTPFAPMIVNIGQRYARGDDDFESRNLRPELPSGLPASLTLAESSAGFRHVTDFDNPGQILQVMGPGAIASGTRCRRARPGADSTDYVPLGRSPPRALSEERGDNRGLRHGRRVGEFGRTHHGGGR
jgi:hypothetical protein